MEPFVDDIEKKKKRKKVLIILLVLLLLFLAVGAALIVWAALSANIKGDIDIGYQSAEIKGSVTSRYYYSISGDGTDYDWANLNLSGTDSNVWTLTGEEEEEEINKSLEPVNLVLTRNAQFVVFEWSFSNDSDKNSYTAQLLWSVSKLDNATVWYRTSANAIDFFTGDETGFELLTSQDVVDPITVNENTTTAQNYAYVMIKLTDMGINASVQGDITWGLTGNKSN